MTVAQQEIQPGFNPAADFNPEDYTTGIAAFVNGTANVIMQLSQAPIGYGVIESPVHSGSVMLHPIKRLRTTLSYIAVAILGTDEERRAYRDAVNVSHRQVRSGPHSPVKYNAFDKNLQLWVAACLYKGVADTTALLSGPIRDADADALYRHCARLGTTLQLPPAMWPADRAAFARYWDENLALASIDDTVRAYFNALIDLKMLPLPLRWVFAGSHRFFVAGFLPPQLREQMRMSWTDSQQRRFEKVMRTAGTILGRSPAMIRMFPFNYYLWDLRRRIAQGKQLV
ncbi:MULTISPECIES: oxygenase MpaB family protein [unclassified Mycobacterium]|uniref:oxygenase MpaB family protein n=1 Tax=unclassified Mycobacterium TaxID=2642494 RepID=UPI000993E517|nr:MULTISPECIES: oxygenase MpaB family protein [unclassified Mycobacterium]